MNCRYCHEEKPFGKSHIIPESFFPIRTDDPRPLKLLTNKEGEFPKKAPIGVYDKTILCKDCEQLFGRADNYAHKTLLQNEDRFGVIRDGDTIVGYELPEYDYNLLKRFFVSVLWRASISTHPFYQRINLGPFESLALDSFRSEESIAPETFAVLLAKFDHPIGKTVLDPLATKLDGINYNQFYLGGYVVYIKTDKRPLHEEFSELVMSPNIPLRVISRDLSDSKELSIFKNIVQTANRRA